jgi:hypothetical protein
MPATQEGANGKGALEFIRSYWIDKTADYGAYKEEDFFFMPATVEDNPVLIQSDPDYVKSIESVSSPNLREAWLRGRWDVFEGKYFTKFDKSFHIVDDLDIDNWDIGNCWGVYSQKWNNNKISDIYKQYLLQYNLPVDQLTSLDEVPLEIRTYRFSHIKRLMDYGFNDPTTCIWMAVDTSNNLWFYREYGASGLFPDEQAEIISDMTSPYELSILRESIMDSQAWNKYGDLGRDRDSPAEYMIKIFKQKEGKCSMTKAEGKVKERVNGWRLMHRWIGGNGIEYPRIFVTVGCKRIINGLMNAVHSNKNKDDIEGFDLDHYLDPIRYGISLRGKPYRRSQQSWEDVLRNAPPDSAIRKFFDRRQKSEDIIGRRF